MARPIAEDPKARTVQIELLREAGLARRFALTCALSATTIALARDAIRRRHPDWSERDVLLEFARVHYGEELAKRIRSHLARRDK